MDIRIENKISVGKPYGSKQHGRRRMNKDRRNLVLLNQAVRTTALSVNFKGNVEGASVPYDSTLATLYQYEHQYMHSYIQTLYYPTNAQYII